MSNKNYHEELAHIRQMMERSSRFISLSGLSGVFAGLTALVGAGYVYAIFQREGVSYFDTEQLTYTPALVKELFITGLIILLVAILCGYFFTVRKTKKEKRPIWDATAKRLLISFSTPLLVGGVFCIALLVNHLFVFVAPVTLIFYGLALVNAERYTFTDVRYLGYCEIALGLISLFILGWGLLFWALGFGILHIVYGIIMHRKYK